MRTMESHNPMFRGEAFTSDARSHGYSDQAQSNTMTVQGTALKTGFLVLIALATGLFVWNRVVNGLPGAMPLIFGGAVAGFILAIVTSFVPKAAPYTAPLYAACEGLALGGISAIYNAQFNGIAIQAFCLTFGILFSMCIAYQSGVIRATPRLKKVVFGCLIGITLLYVVNLILGLFFATQVPGIFSNGLVGIGFSLFVIGVASFMLIIDFDMIENMSASGAEKKWEWYGAFSLMVTLVWLYMEVLRLLAKIQSRD